MSFVGEQIKKYRNIKGMTRQDIANELIGRKSMADRSTANEWTTIQNTVSLTSTVKKSLII